MGKVKPHICFLIFSLEGGGLQNNLLRFIKFIKNDADCTVLIKGPKGGELQQDFLTQGIRLINIRTGYLNVAGWFKIFRYFKSHNFHSICDFTSNFAGIYMTLGYCAGVPNRIAYYGQDSNHFNESFFNRVYNKWVNWLVKKYSTSIVSNSSNALNFFFTEQWKSNQRFKIINNGICIDEYCAASKSFIRSELGIPESGFVVGHSGRLDIKKNHKTILKVAQILLNTDSNIYFIVAGRDTKKLEHEILQSGLQGRVFPLDFRPDIASIYLEFNLFYFPSYTEGKSNSLIEAMIAGIPIVASDIEGNREAMPAYIHNYLVDADDTKAAAKMISTLKDNPNNYPLESVKKWAINKYDSKVKFKELYSELTQIKL